MFHAEDRVKSGGQKKWAKAAGDHTTVTAQHNQETGKYIQDLDCEMCENIRFKPAATEDARVKSVKPSCCSTEKEQPKLSGQVELTTGKTEIGYDEEQKNMVFSFVRHENDAQGKEVLENRARVRTLHGKDRFRSNDEDFSHGAMELRCDAARSNKMVMRRFSAMSERENGETTMDRVLPFQQTDQEKERVRQLRELEHNSREDRSNIHSAASGVAAFAGKKQQKQVEFRKKLSKAVNKAKENTKTDDYQLYLKKKWEIMVQEQLLDGLPEQFNLVDPASEETMQVYNKSRQLNHDETERS